MRKYFAIVGAFLLLGLSGCGKDEQDNSSYNLSVQQSEETIGLEENSSIEQETTDNFDNNTMQVYSEAHPLVDYSTVDLSGINQIVSDGNTDRLLSVGDEAYLFLMKESETSFAVVGEYRGEMLLENGNVYFDSCIIRFKDGITTHGLENGSMVESEFIEAINELIYKDS